jgi:hypothetical protein
MADLDLDGLDPDLRLVTGYEDVRAALRDPRLSPRSFTDNMIAGGLSVETAHQLTPLFRRHGEEHRRHRALLASAFTPRRVERLRPVAAAVAGRLADDLVAAGPGADFDAVFAARLPAEVFAVLFGLPVEDRDRLAAWANELALAFFGIGDADTVARVEAAAADLRAYSRALVADRRDRPGDDLVSQLLEAEIDGERLGDDDLVAIITGFIFAGSETTRRQLGALVAVFADRPDDWRRLGEDHALIPTAVEEVLRLHGIVPGLTRVDVETGERLAVVFVTANRDAAAFEDPERFDIARAGADAHLTFGWGPHFCVGAGLARVELTEAVRALVERFPDGLV